MNLRRLLIPALLILAVPVFSQTQSLGDLARQVRAERQQCEGSQPKVYTNDDLVHSSGDAATRESKEIYKQESDLAADTGKTAKKDKNAATPDKEHKEREAELQARTDEINQQYLGKIAAIRAQIVTAQQTLAQLQRDQVESSFQFQRSSGTSPSILEYQQQQTLFNDQIEAQRKSIVDLTSQLEDAQEAARHAGVPNATD